MLLLLRIESCRLTKSFCTATKAATNAATGATLGFLECASAAAAMLRCAYARGFSLLRICLPRPLADLSPKACETEEAKTLNV